VRPRAKKSLGQNFLVDAGHQQRIVEALEPSPADVVAEIGPGHGALTRHLAGRVRRLVLIELDDALARGWQEEMRGRDDVEVRHQDALTVDFAALGAPPERLKVVGNIPYNITSPLIFHLLRREQRAQRIVLMIQREVADRILAEPGSRTYGALSVGVRVLARAERLFHVPRGAFRPVPNVDSTVIRLEALRPEPLSATEEEDVRTLTRATFAWRRKQLQRILRDAEPYRLEPVRVETLAHAGFDPTARPESLAPDEFIRLARELRRMGRPLTPDTTNEPAWD
jgi:16S rRNA (adenine1518-N6/adenine1519-N6)-dimethyltransferase